MDCKELSNQIDVINNKIKTLIHDFEGTYRLKKDIAYQIHTSDHKSFLGYYSHCKLGSTNWGDRREIYIYACFYKVKKNGQKSKVETGCFAENAMKIKQLI